jgi:hypothetical protein
VAFEKLRKIFKSYSLKEIATETAGETAGELAGNLLFWRVTH